MMRMTEKTNAVTNVRPQETTKIDHSKMEGDSVEYKHGEHGCKEDHLESRYTYMQGFYAEKFPAADHQVTQD